MIFLSDSSVALSWGIKESFVRYVQNAPRSEVRCAGGAVRTEENSFVFPRRNGALGGASSNPLLNDSCEVLWSGGGHVTFVAHQGLLNVLIAEPQIIRRENTLFLNVLADESGIRIDVAELTPINEALSRFTATLVYDGVELFNDQYIQGTELAVVELLVGL